MVPTGYLRTTLFDIIVFTIIRQYLDSDIVKSINMNRIKLPMAKMKSLFLWRVMRLIWQILQRYRIQAQMEFDAITTTNKDYDCLKTCG